ncbi:peptidoglycan-binding protein [Microbacterium sp. 22242]|uniref:peptidoglycan-binding protein n=1 Tax=Microbacterium sp. 22242 TaxID=3453896 RepID=UPI003F84DEEE
MVNGLAAAQWLLNLDSVSPGLCLNYVWRAYAAQGASTGMSAGTAKSAWDQSDGKHWGDRNPPAGAAVWWGTRYDGNDDGDVTISLGGGRVAATDYPGWRQTGSCTLDEREQQVGREYLGWTSSIFDCPIDLNGAGGSEWNLTDRPTTDIQRLVGADPDGIHGPDTDAKVKAWQTANRLVPDGIWGAISDAVGFAIAVDGDPAVRTFAKLQHRVGATIDGVDGPDTTGHLQAALGVKVDGDRGPVTVTAWQTSVGAKVDGIEGEDTWARTQAFLNTGAAFPRIGEPSTDLGRNATDRPTKDIQARLGVPPTGTWDRATSDAVATFQGAQGIDQDRIWGPASDGLAFPPAGSLHGVDFSFARIPVATLLARGVRFVARYLWKAKYDDGRTNKGLSADELAQYRAAGIDVALLYEEDGKELLGGRAAGVRVAQAAEEFRKTLGLGAQPIYFNVDFDIAPGDVPTVLGALDGVASVIGADRVGLYGGFAVIKAAFDAGKIRWGFQTYAWSGGRWDQRAQLQQWANGQWGDSVDFTRAVAVQFGQAPVTSTPPDPEPKPEPPADPSGILKLLQQILDFLKGLFGGGK